MKIYNRLRLLLFTSFISSSLFSQQNVDPKIDAAAKKILASLSLEKKIGQIVCTEISGNYISDDDPKYKFWASLARDYGIGGFVIYGGNPQSAGLLLNKLQKLAAIPILISTDFEGGPGQQFTGACEFPSNMAFAATGDDDLMYRAAKVMGAEGRAIGIHLTYTPVTDISMMPDNPQESGRSFGGNLALQNKMLKAYVKGYHEEGMLTTSKHFPGRGNMQGGPAYPSFTSINKTADQYKAEELVAFQNAINAGVDFMMTEHIAVPSLTGSPLPASVEPKLVRGIIRDQLHFKGIVTSDDLWYDYVTEKFGREDVAVKALEAGHDIVLKPKDPVLAIAAIVAAVKTGRLRMSQIDSSVYKLLYQKIKLGLTKNAQVDIDNISKVAGSASNKAIVQEVADQSITLLKNEGVFPLPTFNAAKTVHITIQKEDDQPNVKLLTKEMGTSFTGIKQFSLKPLLDKSVYTNAKEAAKQADLVVISLLVQRERHGDASPLRQEDIDLINEIAAAKPGRVVVMSFGNPHHIKKIGSVPSFLVGYGEGGFYGNQPVYFTSLVKILKGELIPSGKLPLKLNDSYPVGFGLSIKK